MNNLLMRFNLKLIVKIELLLFFCVILSGSIHIFYFNSHFNIFFFEFLNEYVFSDFKSVLTYSALENPYDRMQSAPANYPPFAYLLLRPLTFFEFNSAYILFNFILLSFMVFTFYKLKDSLKISNQNLVLVIIFIIFSHPFLFAFFRGNLDILVGILLLNILNYPNKNSFMPGLLIGIAGAIKIVPMAFCIYLFATKNYKSMFACFITFIFLTLLSLNFYDLTLKAFLIDFSTEYADYKSKYIIGSWAMSFFSDPWLLSRGFFAYLDHSEILIESYYVIYNFIQILWMSFLTIFVFVFRENISKLFILLLIGMMMIGFPAPSNDYKILYMLPGAVLYLSNLNKNHSTATHILGIASILLFLHYSFFYLFKYISLSSFIRPIFYIISMLSITYIFINYIFDLHKKFKI